MENNKNKKKPFKERLTPKNVTTTFSVIWFVLVFIFTFLATSKELKSHAGIIAAVIFSVIGATFFVWLGLFLWLKKKAKTPNDKVVQEALKKVEEEKQKEIEQQNTDKDIGK